MRLLLADVLPASDDPPAFPQERRNKKAPELKNV